MPMVLIKVRVDETWVTELERIAKERRQPRAITGGLLLEDSIIAATEARESGATPPTRATA